MTLPAPGWPPPVKLKKKSFLKRLLLDYMLGDVNGDVVCKTIRSNAEFEDIKIVIVSGVIKPDDIKALLNSGAEDFIKKPFNIIELTGKIEDILKMKQPA